MGLLTVFTNFRIDSEERFLRMKDSYYSFCQADIEKWVINIRGSYKEQAASFLKDNLGDRLKLYQLESKKGWFHDTRQMLDDITSELVFYWIEDHLCVCGVDFFNQLVKQIAEIRVDYLPYSFFHHGANLKIFERLEHSKYKTCVIVDYTLEKHKVRLLEAPPDKYIIGHASVLSRVLFSRIVNSNDPIIKRYPIELPMDFEKSDLDTHWLPLRYAIPRIEVFASIDDDLGQAGYSLISRGLYPQRITRSELVNLRDNSLKSSASRKIRIFLKSNFRRFFNESPIETINRLYARIFFSNRKLQNYRNKQNPFQ